MGAAIGKIMWAATCRRRDAAKLRAAGKTYAEIAAAFDVSTERARRMVLKYQRQEELAAPAADTFMWAPK